MVDLIVDCVVVVSNDSGLMYIVVVLNKLFVVFYGLISL